MEGQSATQDFELNQERLLMIKEEHQRLYYEMKKKELTHSSIQAKMQQHIRQQWESISKLEKKKSELTLQVQFQESESFSSQANQYINDFMKLLDEMDRLEKQLKEKNKMLENHNTDISKLNKKLRQKHKEFVKAQHCKVRVLKQQKDIFFLENRLSDSLHKYNQLLVSNNSLREEINSLLLTLNCFRRKYINIKRLLALDRKTLSEVVHSATVSYQTGESVKYKSNLIKERAQIDEKKLEEKIKELKILVEQDKQLKEFLEFKLKDRSSSSDSEESSRNEQIMEEQLQVLRGILIRIQSTSDCKEVGHICKEYLQGEEQNLMLFEKVNELSLEIEKFGEEVREERLQLDAVTQQYKEQNSQDLAVKQDIENTTEKLCAEAQHLEDAVNTEAGEFETVKLVMERIYTFLDNVSSQLVSFTIDKGITDDNVLQYLEALERRVMDLILCKSFTGFEITKQSKIK